MLKLTEEFINSVAPNASAMQNGQGLVKKNSFVKLCKSSDETLLFGECTGSGKSNYLTSADFMKPESPVFRCTCPSRQFPCKHTLGLMLAYVQGKTFEVAEIPEDLQAKRDKAEAKETKKKQAQEAQESGDGAEVAKPRKVNKSAQTKKLKTQIEGLELLEKMVHNLLRSGLGTIDVKSVKLLEEQAKQMGDYYLSGAQIALRELILLLKSEEAREEVYAEAIQQLTRLNALAKKGKEYLTKRLGDPELPLETESSIEEWLGHAWQLAELRELGRMEQGVELIQLAFASSADQARLEHVDRGLWLNMTTGAIQETRNLRPFKAAKYVREDDSVAAVVQIRELFIYPGDLNPRIRWEESTLREIQPEDLRRVKELAQRSFTQAVKLVKNQIKNTLAGKEPVLLLHFARLGKVGDQLVLEDGEGKRLVLIDHLANGEVATCQMLARLRSEALTEQAILVRFHHDLESNQLRVQPLTIITDDAIVRLS